MNRFESTALAARRVLGLDAASPVVRAVRPGYELLLRTLYSRGGVTRVLHGDEPIRVRPAFRALREDREPAVFAALRRLVRPGMVVFDVGASFGEFTMVLARWCGPGGRVVAFEPTPASRAALRDHLQLNGLIDRVTIVDAAVSDRAGSAVLHAMGTSGENTLNPARFNASEREAMTVPVTTIDDYCRLHGAVPAVIKLDVEGYELHALRGAADTLATHRPTVIVELHPSSWRDIGEDTRSAAALVESLRYNVVPLEGQDAPFDDGGHILLEPRTARR
jgi:FkbM family methyltransferase